MAALRESTVADGQIGSLVLTVPTLADDAFGERAREVFESNPETEGILVLKSGHPAGIIMRSMFFQKMSSQYGYSLYMKRPVSILMDQDFLSARVEDSISKVGLKATAREQDKLYDYIVVYDGTEYIGVISIRYFFEELSRRNEAQVSVLREQQNSLLLAHEQEVKLRGKLEYQSAAVRNLLDHAEQGFLWFGSDYMIRNEVSYKCQELFGQHVGGSSFLELIAPYFPPDRLQVFEPSLISYFKNNSPVTDTVYLMLLPAECRAGNRHLHFQYRRIESAGQKAVMAVVSDVTDRVAMERALADDRYRQRLLIKAFSGQSQIRRMLEEFRALFAGGYREFLREQTLPEEGMNELFRAVHTYKGDFAQFGFASAADQIHGLEDQLAALRDTGARVSADALGRLFDQADPEQILSKDLTVLSEFLGKDFFEKGESIAVPAERLEKVRKRLLMEPAPDRAEAERLLRSLSLHPVKASLEQYRDYVAYLSGRVGKPEPIFLVEGDDVEVDSAQFDALFRTLVHIFRNSMDHGIESDEVRVMNGKEPQGVIRCVLCDDANGWFTLRITDDGGGMDAEKLRTRAVEKCICTEAQAANMPACEVYDLVFADSFSTKETVTGLSGRGVGLSAVREACRSLGGDIRAESGKSGGTSFVLTLPLLPA